MVQFSEENIINSLQRDKYSVPQRYFQTTACLCLFKVHVAQHCLYLKQQFNIYDPMSIIGNMGHFQHSTHIPVVQNIWFKSRTTKMAVGHAPIASKAWHCKGAKRKTHWKQGTETQFSCSSPHTLTPPFSWPCSGRVKLHVCILHPNNLLHKQNVSHTGASSSVKSNVDLTWIGDLDCFHCARISLCILKTVCQNKLFC